MQNFKELGSGLLLGPQPTEHDLHEAKRRGVKTVIDLRMPGEAAKPNLEQAQQAGLDYVNIPVDKTCLSEDSIKELEQALCKTEGPALLHCATGARAALMLALSRSRKHGWDAKRTFEEARSMGFDIEQSIDFARFVEQVTRQS